MTEEPKYERPPMPEVDGQVYEYLDLMLAATKADAIGRLARNGWMAQTFVAFPHPASQITGQDLHIDGLNVALQAMPWEGTPFAKVIFLSVVKAPPEDEDGRWRQKVAIVQGVRRFVCSLPIVALAHVAESNITKTDNETGVVTKGEALVIIEEVLGRSPVVRTGEISRVPHFGVGVGLSWFDAVDHIREGLYANLLCQEFPGDGVVQ